MARRRMYTPEDELRVVASVHAQIKQGVRSKDAVRPFGICVHTYHHFKKRHGLTEKLKLQKNKHGNRSYFSKYDRKTIVFRVFTLRGCGLKVEAACAEAGITSATYYKWIKQLRLSRLKVGKRA